MSVVRIPPAPTTRPNGVLSRSRSPNDYTSDMMADPIHQTLSPLPLAPPHQPLVSLDVNAGGGGGSCVLSSDVAVCTSPDRSWNTNNASNRERRAQWCDAATSPVTLSSSSTVLTMPLEGGAPPLREDAATSPLRLVASNMSKSVCFDLHENGHTLQEEKPRLVSWTAAVSEENENVATGETMLYIEEVDGQPLQQPWIEASSPQAQHQYAVPTLAARPRVAAQNPQRVASPSPPTQRWEEIRRPASRSSSRCTTPMHRDSPISVAPHADDGRRQEWPTCQQYDATCTLASSSTTACLDGGVYFPHSVESQLPLTSAAPSLVSTSVGGFRFADLTRSSPLLTSSFVPTATTSDTNGLSTVPFYTTEGLFPTQARRSVSRSASPQQHEAQPQLQPVHRNDATSQPQPHSCLRLRHHHHHHHQQHSTATLSRSTEFIQPLPFEIPARLLTGQSQQQQQRSDLVQTPVDSMNSSTVSDPMVAPLLPSLRNVVPLSSSHPTPGLPQQFRVSHWSDDHQQQTAESGNANVNTSPGGDESMMCVVEAEDEGRSKHESATNAKSDTPEMLEDALEAQPPPVAPTPNRSTSTTTKRSTDGEHQQQQQQQQQQQLQTREGHLNRNELRGATPAPVAVVAEAASFSSPSAMSTKSFLTVCSGRADSARALSRDATESNGFLTVSCTRSSSRGSSLASAMEGVVPAQPTAATTQHSNYPVAARRAPSGPSTHVSSPPESSAQQVASVFQPLLHTLNRTTHDDDREVALLQAQRERVLAEAALIESQLRGIDMRLQREFTPSPSPKPFHRGAVAHAPPTMTNGLHPQAADVETRNNHRSDSVSGSKLSAPRTMTLQDLFSRASQPRSQRDASKPRQGSESVDRSGMTLLQRLAESASPLQQHARSPSLSSQRNTAATSVASSGVVAVSATVSATPSGLTNTASTSSSSNMSSSIGVVSSSSASSIHTGTTSSPSSLPYHAKVRSLCDALRPVTRSLLSQMIRKDSSANGTISVGEFSDIVISTFKQHAAQASTTFSDDELKELTQELVSRTISEEGEGSQSDALKAPPSADLRVPYASLVSTVVELSSA